MRKLKIFTGVIVGITTWSLLCYFQPEINFLTPRDQRLTKTIDNQNRYVPTSGYRWPHRAVSVYLEPSLQAQSKDSMLEAMVWWSQDNFVSLKQTTNKSNANIIVAPKNLNPSKLEDSGAFTKTFHDFQTAHPTQAVNYVLGMTKVDKLNNYNNTYVKETIYIDQPAINVVANHTSFQVITTSTNTCAHELGHALGLEHTKENVQSVMNPTKSYGINQKDFQALRSIYDNTPE